MALPQPATTDDVITLGQLLDESFVQNTDKLNVQLMENLSALKTNNDLSKTVANSITKQQKTAERMAQVQERQADTAALAETESAREEARFKGDEKFSEKLSGWLDLLEKRYGFNLPGYENYPIYSLNSNCFRISSRFSSASSRSPFFLALFS